VGSDGPVEPAAERAACSLLTPLEEAVWFGLLRAHAALAKAADAELTRAHGLPLVGFELLVHLARVECGSAGMSDLVRLVPLTPSGLSRLVDRLQAEGLLCRQASADDGRAVRVAITPRGRERLEAAARTHVAVVRTRFLAHLRAGEMRRLAALWERVAAGRDRRGAP
jgi:DNA-binding MarR family transcriptional regulator